MFTCGACDGIFQVYQPTPAEMFQHQSAALVALNGTHWRLGNIDLSPSIYPPRAKSGQLCMSCTVVLFAQASQALVGGIFEATQNPVGSVLDGAAGDGHDKDKHSSRGDVPTVPIVAINPDEPRTFPGWGRSDGHPERLGGG